MTAGVGLIANPNSSSDIRRVVAHASTVPNHEKVNMLRRVLLGLAATAVTDVWYMPDALDLVPQAAQRLELPFRLTPLDQPTLGTAQDTALAAQQFAALGAACMLTLGGDGTARAAVKGCATVPLLALSTGTNNAFPRMIEPTLAGLAAGAVATLAPAATRWRPLLTLWRNAELVDLALVDVAAVASALGGKAVWEVERLRTVVTTRLRPGTVGLSAIGGQLGAAAPPATEAVALTIDPAGTPVLTPLAPGLLAQVPVAELAWLPDGAVWPLPSGTALALDGERELMARAGETWQVQARSAGVPIVDVEAALDALAAAQPQPALHGL